MKRRTLLQALSVAPFVKFLGDGGKPFGMAEEDRVIYELRIYHCYPGKLLDVVKRFREHTTKLFERHGLRNVVYWTALDEPMKSSTLYYVLAHLAARQRRQTGKPFRMESGKSSFEANGNWWRKSIRHS
jgi:hypothetical protein